MTGCKRGCSIFYHVWFDPLKSFAGSESRLHANWHLLLYKAEAGKTHCHVYGTWTDSLHQPVCSDHVSGAAGMLNFFLTNQATPSLLTHFVGGQLETRGTFPYAVCGNCPLPFISVCLLPQGYSWLDIFCGWTVSSATLTIFVIISVQMANGYM